MTAFGAWLKQRRASLDLRQEDLASRVHCSVVTIQKIEAGERRPSRQIAGLLADYFQVPSDERAAFVRYARQAPSVTRLTENLVSQAPWRKLYNQLSNIPAEPTDLIGRQQELPAVLDLLRRSGVRLVTLTGPPGIGKTRLSIELATELFGDFEDGVSFVGLARVSQSDDVIVAIADTLGVRETADRPLTASVHQALQDKKQLLVLDNFEHVLPAAALVAELLAACRWLKVLVTSRAALHVRGEHQFMVPPLALPDMTRLAAADDLSAIPSVALFVLRAQAVNHGFRVDEENAVTIAAICRRLEGLPLAIELAAARLNLLTVYDLQVRLADRFALLKNGALDLPVRHQTLRSAIAWSYDLLNTSEKKLFDRMAVFANGATLDALEAVVNASGDLAMSTLEVVASLLDKSLLHRQQPTVEGTEPRLVMLETIREFARERLAERLDAASLWRIHAEYYLALAEAAASSLQGPEQRYWLDHLETEIDNLRAGLGWCVANEDGFEVGLRLAAALAYFWNIRGHLSEGRRWMVRLLATGKGSEALRGNALYHAGVLASVQADYRQALHMGESSLVLYTRLDDRAGKAQANYLLGTVALYMRDFERAQQFHEASLNLYRLIGDSSGIAQSISGLGLVVARQADYVRAAALFEESLNLLEQIGEPNDIATANQRLGIVIRIQGDFERAVVMLEDSLDRHQKLGNVARTALALIELADTVLALGDYRSATARFEQSLDLLRPLGLKREIAYSLVGLGDVAYAQGNFTSANERYSEGIPLLREVADPLALAWGLRRLGNLAFTTDDFLTAHDHYVESFALCRAINYLPGLSKASLGLARAAWHRHDIPTARTYFADSLKLQSRIGNPYDVAAMLEAVSSAVAENQPDSAVRLLGAADALRQKMRVVLHVHDRAAHDEIVKRLAETLPATLFSEAWRAGQSLSLAAAVSLGLDVLASNES